MSPWMSPIANVRRRPVISMRPRLDRRPWDRSAVPGVEPLDAEREHARDVAAVGLAIGLVVVLAGAVRADRAAEPAAQHHIADDRVLLADEDDERARGVPRH